MEGRLHVHIPQLQFAVQLAGPTTGFRTFRFSAATLLFLISQRRNDDYCVGTYDVQTKGTLQVDRRAIDEVAGVPWENSQGGPVSRTRTPYIDCTLGVLTTSCTKRDTNTTDSLRGHRHRLHADSDDPDRRPSGSTPFIIQALSSAWRRARSSRGEDDEDGRMARTRLAPTGQSLPAMRPHRSLRLTCTSMVAFAVSICIRDSKR